MYPPPRSPNPPNRPFPPHPPKQVKAFRDPTYDRLLPDLRPEMKAMGIKTLVCVMGLEDLHPDCKKQPWRGEQGMTLKQHEGLMGEEPSPSLPPILLMRSGAGPERRTRLQALDA